MINVSIDTSKKLATACNLSTLGELFFHAEIVPLPKPKAFSNLLMLIFLSAQSFFIISNIIKSPRY
nr:MAG TPA: hypothetical protein [Caudoviricetes sp.]